MNFPEKKQDIVTLDMVENIQIALKFLGYPLPQYGVDGYFGKETFDSIAKFNTDTISKK